MELEELITTQNQCLACGSTNFVEHGPPGKAFVKMIVDRTYVQPDYTVRKCSDCALVFKSRVASPSVLEDYYANVPFAKWANQQLYPTERIAIRLIHKLPQKSRVLDFGCSEGRLLSELRSCYLKSGYDINAEAVEVARSRGIPMLNREQVFSSSDSFDAILLMDVFEHLPKPTELLASLSQRLRSGGVLIIATGDSDATAIRGDPANFWYLRNIEHLCMLNSTHAKWLENRLGLKLISISRTSHYDTSIKHRIFEKSRDVAFEMFHRNRLPFIIPFLKRLPLVRKAQHWHERPIRCGTSDHLVICWQRTC